MSVIVAIVFLIILIAIVLYLIPKTEPNIIPNFEPSIINIAVAQREYLSESRTHLQIIQKNINGLLKEKDDIKAFHDKLKLDPKRTIKECSMLKDKMNSYMMQRNILRMQMIQLHLYCKRVIEKIWDKGAPATQRSVASKPEPNHILSDISADSINLNSSDPLCITLADIQKWLNHFSVQFSNISNMKLEPACGLNRKLVQQAALFVHGQVAPTGTKPVSTPIMASSIPNIPSISKGTHPNLSLLYPYPSESMFEPVQETSFSTLRPKSTSSPMAHMTSSIPSVPTITKRQNAHISLLNPYSKEEIGETREENMSKTNSSQNIRNLVSMEPISNSNSSITRISRRQNPTIDLLPSFMEESTADIEPQVGSCQGKSNTLIVAHMTVAPLMPSYSDESMTPIEPDDTQYYSFHNKRRPLIVAQATNSIPSMAPISNRQNGNIELVSPYMGGSVTDLELDDIPFPDDSSYYSYLDRKRYIRVARLTNSIPSIATISKRQNAAIELVPPYMGESFSNITAKEILFNTNPNKNKSIHVARATNSIPSMDRISKQQPATIDSIPDEISDDFFQYKKKPTTQARTTNSIPSMAPISKRQNANIELVSGYMGGSATDVELDDIPYPDDSSYYSILDRKRYIRVAPVTNSIPSIDTISRRQNAAMELVSPYTGESSIEPEKMILPVHKRNKSIRVANLDIPMHDMTAIARREITETIPSYLEENSMYIEEDETAHNTSQNRKNSRLLSRTTNSTTSIVTISKRQTAATELVTPYIGETTPDRKPYSSNPQKSSTVMLAQMPSYSKDGIPGIYPDNLSHNNFYPATTSQMSSYSRKSSTEMDLATASCSNAYADNSKHETMAHMGTSSEASYSTESVDDDDQEQVSGTSSFRSYRSKSIRSSDLGSFISNTPNNSLQDIPSDESVSMFQSSTRVNRKKTVTIARLATNSIPSEAALVLQQSYSSEQERCSYKAAKGTSTECATTSAVRKDTRIEIGGQSFPNPLRLTEQKILSLWEEKNEIRKIHHCLKYNSDRSKEDCDKLEKMIADFISHRDDCRVHLIKSHLYIKMYIYNLWQETKPNIERETTSRVPDPNMIEDSLWNKNRKRLVTCDPLSITENEVRNWWANYTTLFSGVSTLCLSPEENDPGIKTGLVPQTSSTNFSVVEIVPYSCSDNDEALETVIRKTKVSSYNNKNQRLPSSDNTKSNKTRKIGTNVPQMERPRSAEQRKLQTENKDRPRM